MPVPRELDRWLVLGAAGFIGRWVTRELDEQGIPWTGVDRQAGNENALLHCDVSDIDSLRDLLREVRPAVMINAVGHQPGISESAMVRFYINGTDALLRTVQEVTPTARVLLLGSAAEYGNAPSNGKSREPDPPQPVTAYGRSKARQFTIALKYAQRGLQVCTARVFNVLGPGQGPHLLAGALFERVRAGERPLRVHSCNFVRDWIDVRDVARALRTIGQIARAPLAVNICSGHESTVEILAREIVRLVNGTLDPITTPIAGDDLWRSAGDPSALCALGWQPLRDLHDTLYDQWQAAGSPRQAGTS
jgi:nucleoside-diphosphate-sugar epimerase